MNAANASTPNARGALSLADLEAFDTPQGRDPEKVCRCPICQSSERAFHFNTATGVYNCKRASCSATGKLADFWQDRSKQRRAAFSLAPKDCSPNAINALQNATAKAKPTNATAATWQTLFTQSKPISGTAAADYLTRRGIPESIAETANVRALNLYGFATVMFPFECAAAPVAFQARFILDRLGEDGKPDNHRAYGTKSDGVFSTCADALKSASVILCEAPIDALSLAACRFEAIALGGTAAPKWIAPALAFKRVYLAFDNDKNGAGDKAARELAPDLQSFGATTSRLAPLREATADKSDWNMMLLQHGAPALHAWITARRAHIEHLQKATG
jgi:hypothetical protein